MNPALVFVLQERGNRLIHIIDVSLRDFSNAPVILDYLDKSFERVRDGLTSIIFEEIDLEMATRVVEHELAMAA